MTKLKALALALALFVIVPYVVPAPRIVISPVLLEESELLSPQPHYRFTSDGCSGGMSLLWWVVFGHGPDWENCCVTHDFAYWRGGSAEMRSDADAELWHCVTTSGHRLWASLMWLGVRLGGSPYLPLAWRWGYGELYGYGWLF